MAATWTTPSSYASRKCAGSLVSPPCASISGASSARPGATRTSSASKTTQSRPSTSSRRRWPPSRSRSRATRWARGWPPSSPSSTPGPRPDLVAARDDHDVAEIEVVRGDEHRRHLALAVRGIDQDLARDEAEGVLTLARMLDEHDGSEGAASLGREGVDQHLDGGIEAPVDRYPQQDHVAPGQHATADDVAGDRPHPQNDADRGQEAQTRHGAAEDLLVHGSEDVVDAAPENPQEPRGEEDRNREEETRDEAGLEPVLEPGNHE